MAEPVSNAADLIALLRRAGTEQEAGNSAAALTLYEQVLPRLTCERYAHDRAKVLFQMAQLARYEGHANRALALYDELIPLAAELKDLRALGLAHAMRGQLVFLGNNQTDGIKAMIHGLEELRRADAAEAEHLTCHTRYFGRRMNRADFAKCVQEATKDEALRVRLLAAEGC